MDVSSAYLDNWLPRILGAAEDADDFALAETIPEFYMLFDKVGGVYRYDNCKVDRAIFRARGGPGNSDEELVEMILEIMAQDEDPDQSWPGTAPDLVTDANTAPYVLADGVLTVNSNTHNIHNFVLAIDNHIQPRWVNSLTPTELCESDRSVILRCSNPFTSTNFTQLYDLAAADDGVSASLVFTNGSFSTTFTFNGLQWADNSPMVRGKREIPLVIDFIGRKKTTNLEIEVTNVSA